MEQSAFTIRDSRSVSGLGSKAYIVFGVFSANIAESRAYLIVADENALISIDYTATDSGRALPQGQAEAAVYAMAHDVIKDLR
jgi:hypothetical protein